MKNLLFLLGILTLMAFTSCKKKAPITTDCDKGEVKTGILCPSVDDPVCGCDNITYSNSCFAKVAGVNSWSKGTCP